MQAEIERALARIVGEGIRIALAGRTDAGVHATGQVMSFRSGTGLGPETIRRGVNALLPADIAVRDVREAEVGFHARRSATGRTYEYRVRNAPQREPLERHREHWVPQPLDRDAMERATEMLPGRHDLSAFSIGPAGERTVRSARWHREDTLLRFEIEAEAFPRGSVRGVVGTLLWVGRGHISVERFGEVLRAGRRADAGPSAPPCGLCLVRVEYGERPGADRPPSEGE